MKEKMLETKGREKGFSLVESLAAVFVVTVGLLGLAGMSYLAMSGTNTGRDISIGHHVGADYAGGDLQRGVRQRRPSQSSNGVLRHHTGTPSIQPIRDH